MRRGALRRFDKLQKETVDLPVVVTWDRRTGTASSPEDGDAPSPTEDRRQQPSFTWELADFLVVPATDSVDELPTDAADPVRQGAGTSPQAGTDKVGQETAPPKAARRR